MSSDQTYESKVATAKQQLETVRTALSHDVADVIAGANWPFLRDRTDVEALIEHIADVAINLDLS